MRQYLLFDARMKLLAFLLLAGLAAVTSAQTPRMLVATSHSKTVVAPGSDIIGDARHIPPIGWPLDPMVYSSGYILGALTGVHKTGYVIQTLEGFVKVGEASTSGGYVNQRCFNQKKNNIKYGPNYPAEVQAAQEDCTVELNPFPFSNLDEDLIAQLSSVGTSEVVLFYKSYFWLPFVQSQNYLEKVYLVDPTVLPPKATYEVPIPILAHVPRLVTGFYVGRIVKASLDNVIRKSHQVVIQQGTGGAIYTQVSVPNHRLFRFIVDAMATGRYLRLYWYGLMEPFAFPDNVAHGYKTYQYAYKVELLN